MAGYTRQRELSPSAEARERLPNPASDSPAAEGSVSGPGKGADLTPPCPRGNLWFPAGGQGSRLGDTERREVMGGAAGQAGAGRTRPTGMLVGQEHVLEGTRARIRLLLEELWGAHGHLQPPVPTKTCFYPALPATPATPTPWISTTVTEHPPSTTAG